MSKMLALNACPLRFAMSARSTAKTMTHSLFLSIDGQPRSAVRRPGFLHIDEHVPNIIFL